MKQQRTYFVYILTNWNHKVLYIGVTNNLSKRIYQHKNKLIDGFTKKYNVNKLVYYESTEDVQSAITREKQLKGWIRKKKNSLVITINPEWKDLGKELDLI
jgi:putative endonuclease